MNPGCSTSGQHAVDLVEGDPPLRAAHHGGGHAGTTAALRVAGPAFRQEQPEADADRHLAPGRGEGDQRLAEASVVQPSSVPIDRLVRRAKFDGIDAELLLRTLLALLRGEPRACAMVPIPTEADENARRGVQPASW